MSLMPDGDHEAQEARLYAGSLEDRVRELEGTLNLVEHELRYPHLWEMRVNNALGVIVSYRARVSADLSPTAKR